MNNNLAAQQFVAHVQQYGGGTMDLKTGNILTPGKKAYVVGGEKDKSGERIPTHYVPQEHFNADTVAKHMDTLSGAMKGKGASIGAWSDNGNVELDASRAVRRPKEAIRKGAARGEKAIWNNKKMSEIDTSSAKSDARVKRDLSGF